MTSADEFREFGKAMIDYVADYLENIRERPVLPNVRPGYLQQLVPTEAPEEEVDDIGPFKRFLHKFGVDLDPSDVIVGLLLIAGISCAGFYF